MIHLPLFSSRAALAATVLLAACQEGSSTLVTFEPQVWEAQAARPGFTTAGTIALRNETDLSWQLTSLSVTPAEDAQEGAFTAVLMDEDLTLPFTLVAQSSVDVLVSFAPIFVQEYEGTLLASVYLQDFQIGGGGCSAGCGTDAPESESLVVVASLTGVGDEDASFEDCDNGEDDDGDALIDCDDPDCIVQCETQPEDDCDNGIDDDGDGQIDCEDSDCIGSTNCGLDGCEPAGAVPCDEQFGSSTRKSENFFEDYCGAGAFAWTGPEQIWSYVPETSGDVQLLVFAQDWDVDVTVLIPGLSPDGGLECDPDFCLATGWGPPGQPESLTFSVVEGQLYLIVVDGAQGDSGDYELFLSCPGQVELDCGNFIDDDGDGLIDCEDDDCRFDPICNGGGGCQAVDATICGMAMPGSNDQGGSTDSVDAWCGDQGGWDGPEYAWMFFPSASGPVTVRVTGLTDDLDLMVLGQGFGPGPAGGECDPNACISQSWSGGNTDEVLVFDADINQVYVIAVDGWGGAISSFTLTIECEGGIPEDCSNFVDDDGDGWVDCTDPDCFGTPNCGGFGEICDDGTDDDADGLIDCDDVIDCNTFPGCDYGSGDCCTELPNPGCSNDGGEDCVCASDPFCCQVQWDALCVQEYQQNCGGTCQGQGETDCADGADNDNDGLIDCSDADCSLDPGCIGPAFEFACFNNVDDDFDGFTDCADPDCAFDPNCQIFPLEFDCANGIDDDLDFTVDCADSDCFGDPNCSTSPEVCNNGADDDGDLAVDCVDSDCAFFPSCDAGDGDCCAAHGNPGCSDEPGEDCVCALDPFCCTNLWDALCSTEYQTQCGGSCGGTEICGNGLDDDTDGAADCNDSDCFGTPGCLPPLPESACANFVDDDGDGLVDCSDPDCSGSPSCQPLPFEVFCANLVDDDGDGFTDCADTDCFGQASCQLPPETNCDNTIDDDADGMVDCIDPSCFTSPDCATGEFDCDDGVDNDGDSLIDCSDPDCSADVACVDPGDCSPIANLGCGDVVSGSNFMSGSTNDDDIYCGYNPGGWFGPEVAWLFTPNADGFVEISLSGLSEDLDIMALVQDNGCDPNDCEANGWNPPPQPESMDWFAFAGTPYYIVIDGWQGAESSFTMSIDCTPLNEQDCGDGLDDDNDGDTDCADNDCIGSAACPEVLCQNLVDDDGDGNADCGDPDCFLQPFCLPESACTNGLDDDQDGNVDCGDSDCLGDPSCATTDCCTASGSPGCADAQAMACTCGLDPFCCASAWDAVCVQLYVSSCGGSCGSGEICFNGADDDLDGAIDCLDSDCLFDPGCFGFEICGNGMDDDGNGLTDCADPFCLNQPGCLGVEICGNGFDDDQDGDEDCFDTDCAGDPSCLFETSCDNGFDDDADGQTDCDDSDCLSSPGCPVILFSSVDDDPADFLWVPLGNHGANAVWEQGVPNTASQSGNGPGTGHTGSLAWCTGCSLPASDGGRFNGYAVATPSPMDLSPYASGTLTLSWYHWQISPPLPWIDLSRVEVSTDGGANTTTVWGPSAASTSNWQYQEIDLTGYLGTQLIFGFRYDTLFGFGGGNADGWYVDDVQLIWTP